MPLFVFSNLLILIGTHAIIIQISKACLSDGSYCSWDSECCSEKCEYLSENYLRICTSERKEDDIGDMFDRKTSLSVEEPTFCLLYGQCEKDKDCCSKECVVSSDGSEINKCKESRRRRKIRHYL